MITTGARRDRVPAAFEPVVDATVAAIGDVDPRAAVHLYGSVSTGQAQVGTSDVDVLTIGLDPAAAADISRRLSARFAAVCRGVEIGAASPSDLVGDDDESYGFRVFLRHYCVLLAGSSAVRPTRDFPADERAARGFNGDIAQHLARWRLEVDANESIDLDALATRSARKTLLAVAGLVSIHDEAWTTDRQVAAARWGAVRPTLADGLEQLLGWTFEATSVGPADLDRALAETVQHVVDQFAARIGLWP